MTGRGTPALASLGAQVLGVREVWRSHDRGPGLRSGRSPGEAFTLSRYRRHDPGGPLRLMVRTALRWSIQRFADDIGARLRVRMTRPLAVMGLLRDSFA